MGKASVQPASRSLSYVDLTVKTHFRCPRPCIIFTVYNYSRTKKASVKNSGDWIRKIISTQLRPEIIKKHESGV